MVQVGREAIRRLLAVAWAACAAGCATLDEAAVAETHRLEEGQFLVDVRADVGRAADPVLLLPVALDPELADTLGYGGRQGEFAPLLEALDDDLRARACCRLASSPALPGGGPRLFVGSADSELAPPEAREQRLPQDRFAPMVLHLERPTEEWRQAVSGLMAREGTRHAVVVWLGVSQYPKGRQGAFGKKVALGTGHEAPVRFLTAEDKLLEVLQLKGVLVDEGGRVVRAGAEGILARDTPFAAQVFDVEKVLTGDTLAGVLTVERRADLPGAPPSWQVALGNLLAQLRGDRAGLVVP
jgi:hypothetical protein